MKLPVQFSVVRSGVVVFGSLLLASSAPARSVDEPRSNAARLRDSGLLVQVASRSPGSETLAPIAALPLDRPLIARLDGAGVPASALFYAPIGETVANEIGVREQTVASRSDLKYGLSLPQPGRWASLAATLALGLFFFLRRLV